MSEDQAVIICPNCGGDVIVEDCFFPEHTVKDYFGRTLKTRVGNCHTCFEMIDLVNGKVAKVMIIPKTNGATT